MKHYKGHKIHWDGLEYMNYIKSLDEFDIFLIYIHKWLIRRILNATTTGDFHLPTLEEFTYEEACHHYVTFKKEINLYKKYDSNSYKP